MSERLITDGPGALKALVDAGVDLKDKNVLMLGAGGVLAEVYADVATRLAPVDLATAQAMIDEVPGLATVRGYRSQPPGDRDALAAAVQAFSELAVSMVRAGEEGSFLDQVLKRSPSFLESKRS